MSCATVSGSCIAKPVVWPVLLKRSKLARRILPAAWLTGFCAASRARTCSSRIDFVGYVQANHGERNARIEDDARGFGIHVEIEFGGGSDVAAAEGAAHDDDGFDERGDGRIGFEDRGDVGERADGDDGNFAGIRTDDAADEFGGSFRRRA